MLNDKDIKVLNSLFNFKQTTSVSELAKANGLSERSIRNYIDRINENFNFECIELKKGYYTITDTDSVEEFLLNFNVSCYSATALTNYMIYKIALDGKINLSHFASEFEISRTTAKNYLNSVKDYMLEYHLKVENVVKEGIILQGRESDIRRMILNLILNISSLDSIEKRLISPIIKQYFDEIYKISIKLFIKDLSSQLNLSLSDHSYRTLLTYFLIVINRVHQGIYVKSSLNRGFIENCKEYKEITPLLSVFTTTLGINLDIDEIIEIVNIIIGVTYSDNREGSYDNWFEYDLFISKLIRNFSAECGQNLVSDFELYDNLLNHIKPAMYRITNKIKLDKFDYSYIIEKSRFEYDITKKILLELHFFPKSDDLDAYADEISLICLYFKLALDKLVKYNVKNVLVVCTYGYGTSKIIMQKIKQIYHVADIECIPHYELKYTNLVHFDLIITTLNDLELEENIPVLQVNPILDVNDHKEISQYLTPKHGEKINLSSLLDIISVNCKIENEQELKTQLLSNFSNIITNDIAEKTGILKYLPTSNILLNFEATNITQVIEKAGDILHKNRFTDVTYKQNLINSFENYGAYMLLDEQTAIPHTKTQNNVFKTGFTFIRLKTPVEFNGCSVSLFFTFCSQNNKEHLDSLMLISNLIKSTEHKNTLKMLSTPAQVVEFLSTIDDV